MAKDQADKTLAPLKPYKIEPNAVPIANPSGILKLIHL